MDHRGLVAMPHRKIRPDAGDGSAPGIDPLPLRILVSGASGFVGGHVVGALLAEGYQVAAVLRPTARAARFARLHPDVAALEVGTDGSPPAKAIQAFRPDGLIHLAADFGATSPGLGAVVAAKANVLFALELLECAIAGGCRFVVNAGTQSQHRTGNMVYAPTDHYAASKQAFEDFLAAFRLDAKLSIVTLRLSDIYGPCDPRRRILDLLLQAQSSGASLSLSPGEQKIDLVHVSDVAEAFLAAVQALVRRMPLDDAYGVATGRHLSLRDLVRLVEGIGRRRIDARWGALGYRTGVIMNPFVPPPLPGWRAKILLEQGIAELIGPRLEARAAT